MPRSLSFVALSVLALCAASPAFSEQNNVAQPQQQVVDYGDLDVYSDAGAEALIRRVQQAADNVCGKHAGPATIQESRSVDLCRVQAAENAISDIGNSIVTARYYGYTPEVIVGEETSIFVERNATVVIKKPA
jgi:UrcA family protein